jgi:tetratricopeptide (TPR) repeat protein
VTGARELNAALQAYQVREEPQLSLVGVADLLRLQNVETVLLASVNAIAAPPELRYVADAELVPKDAIRVTVPGESRPAYVAVDTQAPTAARLVRELGPQGTLLVRENIRLQRGEILVTSTQDTGEVARVLDKIRNSPDLPVVVEKRAPTLLPDDAARALASLDTATRQMSDLLSAPTPQLQQEAFSRNIAIPQAGTLRTLQEHGQRFSRQQMRDAAFLGFASENYQLADAFTDAGLKAFPNDAELLTARGLVQFERSLYTDALGSFQSAVDSSSAAGLKAAIEANKGLAQWRLGQTREAEEALQKSIRSLELAKVNRPAVYLLSLKGDLDTYLGNITRAVEVDDHVLELTKDLGPIENGILSRTEPDSRRVHSEGAPDTPSHLKSLRPSRRSKHGW